jgi:hypothetical protein
MCTRQSSAMAVEGENVPICVCTGGELPPVGANPKRLVLGDWASGPAWSTMKIPLTITALGEENPLTVRLARGCGYENSSVRLTAVPKVANRASAAPSRRSYGTSAVLADIGSRIAPRRFPASS